MTLSVDESVARGLLQSQFPQWAQLSLQPIENGGWCNFAFRLGEDKIVRLPRHEDYARQVDKECAWLPSLPSRVPLEIPAPLGLGEPHESFALPWAVYRWIDGEIAVPERIKNQNMFARDLGQFLRALQRVDTSGAPPAGAHNFHRGGALANYDDQVCAAIATLLKSNRINATLAMEVWKRAVESRWGLYPVWIHGDVSVGNLLVRDDELVAVIDFGNMAIGDPACDLVMAWTFFDDTSRGVFRQTLEIDAETWHRSRAWALWKALILAAEICESNAYEARDPWKVITTVLRDYIDEN